MRYDVNEETARYLHYHLVKSIYMNRKYKHEVEENRKVLVPIIDNCYIGKAYLSVAIVVSLPNVTIFNYWD